MMRLSRWCTTWGASEDELQRTMPGDDHVVLPGYQATLGITINAAPEAIWRWIVQMGYQRGGLYSYDWLDRLFGYLDAPSADHILPRWQHLSVGDVIPIGRGGGFPVRAVEPFRSLVLGGYERDVEWSWELALTPLDRTRTRLVSRSRVWLRRSLKSTFMMLVMTPAAFLMTRRMLVGIKERAESMPNLERKAA
jgi:hypothetical protein